MEGSLAGKTIVVTGATSGIGLAIMERLVRLGAAVIGVGRSQARCQEAQGRLLRSNPGASVDYCVADLALQSQVRCLGAEIRETLAAGGKTSLDGLINNAGTFTWWLTLTPEGFETQWAVNHLAPFLLTHELLPLLRSAPDARVVCVSSASHYNGRLNWDDLQLRRHYNGLQAYQNTKLANVLFTLEFNRRVGPSAQIRAFAADPGLVKTDIGLKATPALVRKVWQWRRRGGVSPEKSAAGIVLLLSEASLPEAGLPGGLSTRGETAPQASPSIYWKDGQARQASRFALDRQAAARLWQQSERMCGIEWER
jgi:NAD(P)-dependent dehydrogenase (short-subunit alcohol dehydrogenase family)